jgi:hypothetical protein
VRKSNVTNRATSPMSDGKDEEAQRIEDALFLEEVLKLNLQLEEENAALKSKLQDN